jgi:hypothetical protein
MSPRSRATADTDPLPPDGDLSELFTRTRRPRRSDDGADGAAASPVPIRPAATGGDPAEPTPALAAPAAVEAPPAPAVAAAPAAAAAPVAQQAMVAAASWDEDDDSQAAASGAENLTRQATVTVSLDVYQRFMHYINQQANLTGRRPYNQEVMAWALNSADGRYQEIVDQRRPRTEPGQRFGSRVPGRRIAADTTLTSQLSWRPTHAELADIKRLARISGAGSMAAFITYVLDAFLPQLPQSRRRGQ